MTVAGKVLEVRLSCPGDSPKGDKNFYRCDLCMEILYSVPDEPVACKCRNIYIDTDYLRLIVKDLLHFTVLRRYVLVTAGCGLTPFSVPRL